MNSTPQITVASMMAFGTSRRASVAKTKNGYYIVTPDNGSLTGVLNEYGIEEIREIENSLWD